MFARAGARERNLQGGDMKRGGRFFAFPRAPGYTRMRKSDRPFFSFLRVASALERGPPLLTFRGCYAWARPSKNRAMETAPASGVPMVLSP